MKNNFSVTKVASIIPLPFLLMFALMNSCIELEISAPSFLDIMNEFQVSEAVVGLTITYNLLGFCIASLVYGPLSECYGRRLIMLVGNGILALGAIACVVATSMEWLLIARLIQGFGAATSAVVVSAIIADVYKTNRAARLYGLMNVVFTTLMAIAPLIGGLINSAIGWRGNYGVVALICVISWVLLFFFLQETNPTKEKIKFGKIIHAYKTLLFSRLFLSLAIVPSLLYACYMVFVAMAPFIYMKAFKLGSALLYPIIFARSIEVFPHLKGTASSAIMSLRYFLCSCITGLASYVYQERTFMLGVIIFTVAMLVLAMTASIIEKLSATELGE
ncbi:MAG TPA: MFS transporter [Gammaproteobacteria bacterium]|nr:MFS transporter [Gammaproteobacteria bacterium]